MARVSAPSFFFCLSFHFSGGQNRESRSSVFLCSETARKRLLRRLQRNNFRTNWFNTSDVEACIKKNAFLPHTTDLLLQFSADIIHLLTHHILYKTTGILESLDWPVNEKKVTLCQLFEESRMHTQKKIFTNGKQKRLSEKWYLTYFDWWIKTLKVIALLTAVAPKWKESNVKRKSVKWTLRPGKQQSKC